MQEQLSSLREGKQILKSDVVSTRKDKRTIRPFPVTTTGEYGWLSSKPEFRLENPHDYVLKFPNPMDEVKLLRGNIPGLAPGVEFY
ncbi:uncharacterized protein LOC122504971 [Leptopilina heterotoma]|uniref:uncharacterized protein LOC122504971 n=1 Tax=Leptopilina heterotoma TaxID=63436 RepID=UPI001CA979FB|nr:uncharacterized protein LOC122504971 [Leptopilina heterotoma]